MNAPRAPLVLSAALLLAACSGSAARSAPAGGAGQLLTGNWGGLHAGLVLTASGGRIEFDCASGSIDAPLHADTSGAFSATGTYAGGHGGPVRQDAPDARQPAQYQGTVSGKRMELTVSSGGETIGSFQLERDGNGPMARCLRPAGAERR